jgi:poly(A) polymerase/tRNA nucleotidyltransferase (CCA-adding enzyme)
MKMAQNSPIPAEVIDAVNGLEKADFEAYLVGGCVRDIFLGRKPKDWDITTNAKPEEIQKIFSKTVYENIFGTVAVINEENETGEDGDAKIDESVRTIEVTPYRLESAYSDRRHPDKVLFSDKIEDDLKRRDLTINAIAVTLSKGAIKDIIDLFGGFKDIKDKIIRTVGKPADRFNEDALRMMRAIRLAVELGFTIEKETYTAIQSHNSLMKDLSAERVRDEFTKLIMSPDPKKGMDMLHETGLLKHFIPELETGIGIEQKGTHVYDVWEHILRSLQHSAEKGFSLEVRLAALFHDIGKPKTRRVSHEKDQYTFYGHEVIGSRETRKILERMKFSRAIIEKVYKLTRWHMFFSDTEQISLSAVRRMVVNVGRENIWDLMNVRVCDRIGTGRPKENPYRLRKYRAMIEEALAGPISVSMLKVNGEDIMKTCKLEPGPKIGYILHALFEEIMDDVKLNTREYLEKRARELTSLSEKELKKLGEAGKERREEESEKKVEEIRKRHFVS